MKRQTTITIEIDVLEGALKIFPGKISKICEDALRQALTGTESKEVLLLKAKLMKEEIETWKTENIEILANIEHWTKELEQVESRVQNMQNQEQKTTWQKDLENVVINTSDFETAWFKYLELIASCQRQNLFVEVWTKEVFRTVFDKILAS